MTLFVRRFPCTYLMDDISDDDAIIEFYACRPLPQWRDRHLALRALEPIYDDLCWVLCVSRFINSFDPILMILSTVVHLGDIPPALRWLQYFSILKYCLEALSVNEINSGLMIEDTLEGVPVNVSALVIMKLVRTLFLIYSCC